MRLGLSLTTDYCGYDDVRAAARHAVERARAAESAGLDSLFVGDHHVTPHPYLQNVPILARLLAEWGDRPAGCLFLLPLWNPVLLAEQVGTLAAVARAASSCSAASGRVGASSPAWAPTRPPGPRPSRSASTSAGACGPVRRSRRMGGSASGAPDQPSTARGRVEVWMACGPGGHRTGPPAWATAGSVDRARPSTARAECDRYRERCEAHGRPRPPSPCDRDVYVGATEADAEEVRRGAVASGYRGFHRRR